VSQEIREKIKNQKRKNKKIIFNIILLFYSAVLLAVAVDCSRSSKVLVSH